jgi:hypothetical protein
MLAGLIIILLVATVIGAVFGGLHTRRLLSRFSDHLNRTRDELDDRYRLRRNLVPSFIAFGAGLRSLGCESLETLDNAAELVIRSKGFEERLVAENRLSSALNCLRKNLAEQPDDLPPTLTGLISALDERETGLAVTGEFYNRQVQSFNECFSKIPYRWIGPVCGYHPVYPVEIRLSSTPAAVKPGRPAHHQEKPHEHHAPIHRATQGLESGQ